MLLILTPIQTSFIAINNLLKDYAQGGWAPWPGISFFQNCTLTLGQNIRLQRRKLSAHTAGGLAILHPTHPNHTKPIDTALLHLLILSQLIGRVQSFGKVFSSRRIAKTTYFFTVFSARWLLERPPCASMRHGSSTGGYRRRWDDPADAVD